jgi:hypothetical protein
MGEGGGLRSVAEVELSEHIADVGGHGLCADVQAGCDLGVGQALPEEAKDLELPLAELAYELGAGSPRHPQGTKQRCGRSASWVAPRSSKVRRAWRASSTAVSGSVLVRLRANAR